MNKSKFLIVDGNNVAYRAFYAITSLTTSNGDPVNAVYGFIRMLQRFTDTWKPTHLCVAFDRGLPHHRMELLPTYKQQRKPMPDELRSQFPLMTEYLKRARIPFMVEEGVEADDMIATQAAVASREGSDVLVVSSDKDLFQLVDDSVDIVLPAKADQKLGAGGVLAKTGVAPRDVLLWLALMGDQSDNIPGIPGVGAKTAAKLVNEYRSLDGIYEHLEALTPTLKKKLRDGRTIVERNLSLMRLLDTLDLPVSWREMAVQTPDWNALYSFYEKLEFREMMKSAASPELF